MSSPAMALPVTHRSVLAIAVPIMLSNVTEPMIGLVNTIVVGRLHEAYYIGAVAVGALVFSFLFWGFGFLRLSTGGYAAQATGAGDAAELTAVLFRALMIAVAAGLALLLLSPLIGRFVFDLVGGSPEVRRHGEIYFATRIWSAPFTFCNFALMGWFIGQGRTRMVLAVQLVLNLTNMGLSALLVLHYDLAVFGVGLAAVLAEATAALLGAALVFAQFRRERLPLDTARIFDRARILGTLKSNTDIMIRTLCLVSAFAWFTARGARSGDVIVAANAVLLNLFELSAYLIDGFAYASEALVGQAVGAKDRERFLRGLKLTTGWALVAGLLCSLAVLLLGPWVISLSSTNADVVAAANDYLLLAALTPFLGALCFQLDGIFTGAMATREMRNMMVVSLGVYLAGWSVLEPALGNAGLWLALCLFFVARGVTFAFAMPGIIHRAFPA